MIFESRHRPLQGIRRKPVVGIEHTDIVTLGTLQSFVAGMRLTTVLRQGNHFDTGITGCILLEQAQRAIGRTIIDTDDLNILERLSQQRVETLRKESLSIIDGNKNTNLRHDG